MSHNPQIKEPFISLDTTSEDIVRRLKETNKMAKPMKPTKKPPKKPMKPGC